MKKILFILLLIVALVFGGLLIFVSTYDINRLKPAITSQLTQVVGNPVTIEELSLHLGAGIRLGIKGFAIKENGVSVMEVSEVQGSLKLIPLLRKQVQVGTVKLINPKLQLQKNADGNVQVRGIDMQSDPSNTSEAETSGSADSAKTSSAPPVDLTIHRIEIRNGEISYQDLSPTAPMNVTLTKVDVTLTNVSMKGTVGFEIAAAVFGNEQNIRAKGSLSDLLSETRTLSRFSSEIDLNSMDFEQAFRQIPQLQTAGIRNDIKGSARLNAEKIVLGSEGLLELEASALLEGGQVHLNTLEKPFANIALYVIATTDTVTIEKFHADLLGGSVSLKGSSSDYLQNPNTNVDLNIENLSVKEALKAAGQAIRLDGELSLNFKGSAIGKDWPVISQSLTGNGNFVLKKGMLLEANPVKEMLNKLNFIPGFEEMVNKQIPEALKAKIDAPTTPILKPLSHTFAVQDGVVTLNGFELPTELFTLQSDMSVKLSGHAFGRGKFIFGQSLSESLTQGSAEMNMLTNQKGAISIPIRFNAGNEGYSIFPELGDLGVKQIISKGQQLLSGLLSSTQSGSAPEGQVEDAPTSSSQDISNLLKSFNL